ncbi:DUF1700 domain-containing protein [Pseudoduganella namucuonensis]|uniref:DUF1700 domain-containing protein n=1 Tax=Pseudoduganella namucuonensis TaxID=1035707 RepID=A0A1I7HB37_9BURK|nr:DUF1700 domain-containing protein [Pseudoduganella namucuonensis]SFU57918.1 Protein of unknown function [Pseudoduganella namucuonensis]
MNKQAYLDTLRKALAGLPPETVAKTLAYYEQRFIDGAMAGRGEEEISAELGEPRKIAMTLRANVHLNAFEQKKTPVNLARATVSFLGLAVFNLFMVVPAMVYGCLLMAVYACAFAFYIGGIAITASGLSGTNELVLDGPFREFLHFEHDEEGQRHTQTKVSIGHTGIEVFQEPVPGSHPDADDGDDDDTSKPGKIIERAEQMAASGVHISTDLDSESRVVQAAAGMGLVLVGILLCLLSLVITKYTVIGIKRYIQMNFSLLQGR